MSEKTKEVKAMFDKARKEGRLDDAFDLWMEIQSGPDGKKQADWCDHNSRFLFQDYRKKEDWVNAKRVCEATLRPESKTGRVAKLEEETNLKYDEI